MNKELKDYKLRDFINMTKEELKEIIDIMSDEEFKHFKELMFKGIGSYFFFELISWLSGGKK